jgi:hypothetical protein
LSAAAVCEAKSASSEAHTTAVGCPRATSSAKLGPDRAATRRASGRLAATTWCGSARVAVSKPLHAHSNAGAGAIAATAEAVSRRPDVAVATITSSALPTARARSGSISTASGMRTPGR